MSRIVPSNSNPSSSRWQRLIDRSALGAVAVSLFLHAMLILVLALIIVHPPDVAEVLYLIIQQDVEEVEDTETEIDLDLTGDMVDEPTQDMLPTNLSSLVEPDQELEQFSVELTELDSLKLLEIPNLDIKSDFGGRDSGTREKLLEMFGGNMNSELAVRNGLKWLAERQRSDGSWSFDHRRKSDKHADHQAGTLANCTTGATGLALMAFLGAGDTQDQGEHKDRVEKALEFLVNSAVKVPEGYDLRGRNGPEKDKIPGGNYPMYAHSLATIALCEAYAMTKDRRLRTVAQGAIDFIFKTRNRDQGGWRYRPEEVGDLSVTGWMIMALQSGKTAGLRVNKFAFSTSTQFLDATQSAEGAKYAYVAGQGPKPSTTSIGLLCRMYLGWETNHKAIQSGVVYLSSVGPSPNNIYFNYYATQVMHHVGGASWSKWNLVMRDSLIASQVKSGPEKGSWNATDPHGRTGGRLYQTCLSTMTLEVYYRHLPLYQMRSLGK
ncbi:MAG: terpene cyclase/mutase family protein [Planctomycetaceae bacterium]|nr:terpene cyclase/mutase family protein [Planctomycetaceae bacterium]